MVVMPSVSVLSIGITKLSGSNPFLKVAMAIAKEIITIMKTASRFVINKSIIELHLLLGSNPTPPTKKR